jgi:hypothetical protein
MKTTNLNVGLKIERTAKMDLLQLDNQRSLEKTLKFIYCGCKKEFFATDNYMKIHQKRWTKTLKIEFHLGMGISFKDRKINALSRAKKNWSSKS